MGIAFHGECKYIKLKIKIIIQIVKI